MTTPHHESPELVQASETNQNTLETETSEKSEQVSVKSAETQQVEMNDSVEPAQEETSENIDEVSEASDAESLVEQPAKNESAEKPEDFLSNEEILTRIESLAEGFNQRSQVHEETIRKMHRRIEELQEDQVRTLLKPVFERLAGLHAQADEGTEQARLGTLDQNNTLRTLEQFKDSIEDLLSMLDVESVEATIGGLVDRKKHYAVKTKKTGDKSLDKTIYKIVRQGFTFAGADRVMLPARVIAYKYDASLDISEQSQPESALPDETPTIRLDGINELENK